MTTRSAWLEMTGVDGSLYLRGAMRREIKPEGQPEAGESLVRTLKEN